MLMYNLTVANSTLNAVVVGSCQSTGFAFWTYGYYCYLSLYLVILFLFSLYAARRIKKTIKQPTEFNNLLEMQKLIVSNSYPAFSSTTGGGGGDSGLDMGAGGTSNTQPFRRMGSIESGVADTPNKDSIDTNQPLTPSQLSATINGVEEKSREGDKQQHVRYLHPFQIQKKMSSIDEQKEKSMTKLEIAQLHNKNLKQQVT